MSWIPSWYDSWSCQRSDLDASWSARTLWVRFVRTKSHNPHTSFENAILCTTVEVFTEVECVPLKAFISYFLGYRLINPRVTSEVEWLNLRRLRDFIAPVMVSLGRLDTSLKSSLKSCLITSLYDLMLWYSSILHDSQFCDLPNSCDNTSRKIINDECVANLLNLKILSSPKLHYLYHWCSHWIVESKYVSILKNFSIKYQAYRVDTIQWRLLNVARVYFETGCSNTEIPTNCLISFLLFGWLTTWYKHTHKQDLVG